MFSFPFFMLSSLTKFILNPSAVQDLRRTSVILLCTLLYIIAINVYVSSLVSLVTIPITTSLPFYSFPIGCNYFFHDFSCTIQKNVVILQRKLNQLGFADIFYKGVYWRLFW